MRQRILVIDDSIDIHELVAVGLAGEPIDRLEAFDGPAGLAIAAAQSLDLILLDVDMPSPNGFEVCKSLKSDSKTVAIPVIFLTGASSTSEKIRGLDLGAIDYITKPFDPAELRARVSAALRTKYLMDLLAKRAMIDGLTGLWNRSYFEQRLTAETALARRTERPLACLMIDVDHFKSVNDRFGHTAGDLVLRTLGQTLTMQCRTEDIVCRYGGEEFVVLIPNTSAATAMVLAERIRAAVVHMNVIYHAGNIALTCSIGAADLASAGEAALVASADQALYRAKELGRNRVECFESAVLMR
jgi:diguanylate cyclase (GGDEF)-like protein